MNELAQFNLSRLREVERLRDQLVAAHGARELPRWNDYPLPRLRARFAEALSARWGQGRLEPQVEVIDRGQFGGDLTLKFPQLLSDGGPKVFITKHLPWIVETLRGGAFHDAVAAVNTKGMYVNLTLSDDWLIRSAELVTQLGEQFGSSDVQRQRVVLIDYSSPNIAKVLHAGHIRSTIIGHVLSKLHEACGALVYRVNHINDFGGFGFMLEGFRRFGPRFTPGSSDNEKLLEVYRIRRTLERLVADKTPFAQLQEEDRSVLGQYVPGVPDADSLKAEYAAFVAASDARFAALEAGDAEEVELWKSMVAWSMGDFEGFYRSLDIHIDFLIGESFYVLASNILIDECVARGTAVRYTDAEAAVDLAPIATALERGAITDAEAQSQREAIRKDVGATVVRLGGGERLVVRRADGLSIYATRDLGAIQLRGQIFGPSDFEYVVGQEQRVHFDRLFKAAYAMGIAAPDKVRFRHIYFGFYVDAKTGRKLSSRNTVANVNQLLAASVDHFRAKSATRYALTDEELAETAQQLAVGSLIFNDLKQDVTSSVDIDSESLDVTIAGFEKSGGAYVVYTACRARGILRKCTEQMPRQQPSDRPNVDPQEAMLLLQIQQIPDRLAAATEKSNPTLLIRHLLDIANLYNSYYVRVPVMQNGVVDPLRLLYTRAVEQSLTNALRVCHIECPEKI